MSDDILRNHAETVKRSSQYPREPSRTAPYLAVLEIAVVRGLKCNQFKKIWRGDLDEEGDYKLPEVDFMTQDSATYPCLGLIGGAAELVLKVQQLAPLADIISEAGDVIRYLQVLLASRGSTLTDAIESNTAKINDRMERNTVNGSGGFR